MRIYIIQSHHSSCRHPYSSLLGSVSECRWKTRTDRYERLVQRYTWLMEEELYVSEVRTMVKTAEAIINDSNLLSDKGKVQVSDSQTRTLLPGQLS